MNDCNVSIVMTQLISVCCIVLEMSEPEEQSDVASGGADNNLESPADITKGRRVNRDLTVEIYCSGKRRPKLLFSKSRSVSESSARALSCDVDGAAEEEEEETEKDSISFVSGNPFVEITRGILHLYKENSLSTLEAGSARCDSVCILSVPASMACRDLLSFTAAVHADVKHIRVIRDSTPNQYMALLTFRSQLMAREFYTSFNGVAFNSLEPDCVCQLVFVSSVEVSQKPGPAAPPGHTELPTCPVCLERMDESVDGILTILCNHSFHSACLSKWADTSCPVCRYFQTPEMVEDNRCLQCYSQDNLWICLICGHVGCGRYVEGHAYQHYEATEHCYAMQLGSNRVWDYAGDNFVHRLFQNKGDGKLVEGGEPTKDPNFDEKMDSMQLEWTYHLTAQLDRQKKYFEEKLLEEQLSLAHESHVLDFNLKEALDENKKLKSQLTALKGGKAAIEKKIMATTAKLVSAQQQIQEEREITKALQKNQEDWQEKFKNLETRLKEKDKELEDIREQLRDVMFYFEAQKQVSESGLQSEIAEGHIVVPSPSTKPRRKRK